MYGVQQGGEGCQNRAFFAYVIYGWPPINFNYLFIRKFTSRRTIIIVHLRGTQMTLAAFQEHFSFKFLPKTVIRKFWQSQFARHRVPVSWSTHRKGTRTRSHCSCLRYHQFQMRRRTQKTTTRNRRNSDAVIGEVDGCATMETFVDQGDHLECHLPSNRQPVQIHHYRCDVVVFLGARYEPCRSILHTLQPVHQAIHRRRTMSCSSLGTVNEGIHERLC